MATNRTRRGAIVKLYCSYRKQARVRGVEFLLDKKHFEKLIFGDCVYCGTPPISPMSTRLSVNVIDGDFMVNGVDRIDNKLGYTEGNTATCCRTCNQMKSVMDKKDFLQHISKIIPNLVKDLI